MDTNSTVPALGLNMSAREADVLRVAPYSVYASCACLVLLAVPGLLANTAVMLSSRCKKGVRCLQYALHYALFTTNIVLCVLWLPLHTAQLLLLHSGAASHPVLCFTSTALLHFCMATVIFLCVSLGVLHLNHLSSTPAAQLRSLVRRSLPASLCSALLLTLCVLLEQPTNLAHELCTSGFFVAPDTSSSSDVMGAASGSYGYTLWYSLFSLLLAVTYCITLVVMVIILSLALCALRSRVRDMLATACVGGGDCGEEYGEEGEEDIMEISREEPSKHSSVTFKDPEISETFSSDNRSCKLRKSPSPKTLKFKDLAPADSDEEDDAAFERKMRMRLQKTGSGRRHTVANIGLGDSANRRNSLEVPRNGPNCAKSYNYIRKWSVDITSLQAQLENPRKHTGSYPFRELGILPENPHTKKSTPDSINEVDEEETPAVTAAPGAGARGPAATGAENGVQTVGTNNNSGEPAKPASQDAITTCAPTAETSEEGKSVKTNGCNNNSTPRCYGDDSGDANHLGYRPAEEEEGESAADRPLLTHVPSIIIHENASATKLEDTDNKTENARQEQHHHSTANSDTKQARKGENNNTGGGASAGGGAVRRHTSASLDEEIVRRLKKQLRKTKHLICFYALTLLCCLPLWLVLIAQPAVGPQWALNLSGALAPVLLANCSLQPLYLAWMDTRLHNAMSRLWAKMTHWTCVCYCNIGKGKRLFGKPAPPDSTTAAVTMAIEESKLHVDTHSSIC